MESESSENLYKICVTDPIIQDNTLRKRVIYKIQGNDPDGSFEVLRGYKDFLSVRKILINRWPGCIIPSIPPKQFIVIKN